ncbi:MAG: SpoIID/LytB domain-containing protein [Candidatus Omnitrophota bacterium]
MIKRPFLAFIVLIAIYFFICYRVFAMGDSPPQHKPILIRVLVEKDLSEVKLYIKGDYKILDPEKKVLDEGRSLKEKITSSKNAFSGSIRILPGEKTNIYINNRQFRGEIDIIRKDDGKLMVINHIDVEEYLYGVLYHEVSHRWPIEVLKAQAIAARTYALYQKFTTTNKYFDLTSDVYSQMYGGRTSETYITRKAVNLTMGEVLTYEGKVFPAYFHATCGGSTASSNSIWSIDLLPLRGVKCAYCEFSPHYAWKKDFKSIDIEASLKKAGYDLTIVSIDILKRDPSGRVLEMVIKGKDKLVKLDGNKFRLIVGPDLIRSADFNVKVSGKYIFFDGKGWGHGVGMCQWGAYGMAKEGWRSEEILEYYYPASKLIRLE